MWATSSVRVRLRLRLRVGLRVRLTVGLRVRFRVVGDLERDHASVARAPYSAVLVPRVYGDLHVRARAN